VHQSGKKEEKVLIGISVEFGQFKRTCTFDRLFDGHDVGDINEATARIYVVDYVNERAMCNQYGSCYLYGVFLSPS